MVEIKRIIAREILDSRGNPTVESEVELSDGSIGIASCPSGASTGTLEAHELRDNNYNRYNGNGVLQAVNNVNKIIAKELFCIDPFDQRSIDKCMIDLDKTKNKSNLGANALLSVSLATAKSCAKSLNQPLYRYLGGVNAYKTPVPMMNIINGGKHADNDLDIQEFMIMPHKTNSIKESIRIGVEIFHSLKSLLKKDLFSTNVGDEGGFAPGFKYAKQALDYIEKSVIQAGFELKKDIVIALDVAASELYSGNKYSMEKKSLDTDQLIQYYENLMKEYPIFSIEDPCDEKDYEGWKEITHKIGSKVQLVGDDLFVTNSEIIKKGIADNLANAVLIKTNQIGTLTETLESIELAKNNNYKTIISHRSGETEDNVISHIAVATNSNQIKTGSLSRSDRMSKYNELLRISETLGNNERFSSLEE